jgi:predicted lysophospholipase L1 biosynthesis ABC-type transport system permease subunit
MEDLRHLEFFAVNSKEIVEKQVDSYRQQHSYAGTIIGVTALFIPFFLSNLVGAFLPIQLVSIIPIALFIWAILLMLNIFKTKPLDQAYNVEKYQVLLEKTYKEILLNEIEANSSSYSKNKIITEGGNKSYITAVRLTTIALLTSIILLLANQFLKIEKVPTKVQLVNIKKIPRNNLINDSTLELQITSPDTIKPR